MKRSKNILWGIILIVVGIILGGNALELFNIDVFFNGWWTLFIIVPGLFGLATDDDKCSSFIALIIGVLLLLSCQNIIDFDVVWKLIVPIIVIGIGLSLIFKTDSFKKAPEVCGGDSTAAFSGQKIKVDDEFTGKSLNAIFGGIELDLRDAKIKGDTTINVTSVFGGVDILVPDNVLVKIKSTSVFGGVDNKVQNDKTNKKNTIYVDATCIFGGVEIK